MHEAWANLDERWPALDGFVHEHIAAIALALVAYSLCSFVVTLMLGASRRRSARKLVEEVKELRLLTNALKNAEDRRLMADTKRLARVGD